MSQTTNTERPWRDLTDPRRAVGVDDLEAGLKEPVFENLDIPEALGPVTITVDDHKIKRFSFTQDDYSPWYLQDGASPFGGARIGQPCLLGNDLVQLFTTRYRASKTVGFHTEEQMWFDSPAKLGERVTMKGTYVEAYERRGQGYVVMEAQATGEDGRSIVRHRGVEILRTVPGKIAGRGSEKPEKRVTGEVSSDARRIETITRDVRAGDVLAPTVKTITAEQAAVFSRIGEYVHNIHNDLRIARAGELPTLIVQGQQQAGLIGEAMARAFGASFFTDGWFKVKFVAPLQVFDPIELSGVVTDVTEASGGKLRVELEVWARRASDQRLTTVGWASGIVDR
ncbi:MaoC family dehydratase [Caballeronia sp. GAFFF2]|uniref:MaoC family dehydratase n=1 Tax=Caballeronia sp. GAFFF2 TaxID=2921741 RepID=UPI0020281B8A|nr:MaoC family dehydratase [Caballeronia sp. GAFFF2]